MKFFFVSLLTISVTTLIIYKLANNFLNYHLKLKSLIYCALCSLCITVIIPRVISNFFNLGITVAFLAVCALLFAYLIAYYDHAPDEADMTTDTSLLLPAVITESEPLLNLPNSDVSLPKTEHKNITANATTENELSKTMLPEIKNQDITMMSSQKIKTNNSKLEYNLGSVIDDVKITEQELMLVRNLSSLDDLLDFAFSQKEQHNNLLAMKAFKKALKLYPDNEMSPLIMVEMGSILKNEGNYDEAVDIFTTGRDLCKNNKVLQQQFIDAIAYLRIVKNILAEYQLKPRPFSSIPMDIVNKIDAEFQEWHELK